MDTKRDFVSNENRHFSFRIGRSLASSLSGFIAGVTFASIIWFTAVYFSQLK